MEQTGKYGLSQWDAEDRILREDFNADNAMIEAALEAQAAAIANCGNCKIVTGNYAGNNKTGPSNPVTLTFPVAPLAVFVIGDRAMIALRPNPTGHITDGGIVNLRWTGANLAWYHNDNAYLQMNVSGTTYYYIALLPSNE